MWERACWLDVQHSQAPWQEECLQLNPGWKLEGSGHLVNFTAGFSYIKTTIKVVFLELSFICIR